MNPKIYYKQYNDLIKKHERISYRIASKGLADIYAKASKLYDNGTPVELLVKESDTLDILKKIYDSVGIATAVFVDSTFPRQKSLGVILETKAAKKPKPYVIDNSDKINYWKQEFLRYTQSADCAKKVRGVTDTTRDQIRKIMSDAAETGAKQVAKSILGLGGEISTKKRALLIARTENAVSSNKAAVYAAQSSGLVLYKQWIARSGDDRTRDAHAAMVGSEPIPMDALFTVGDQKMLHPGDSSNGATSKNICNCRCVVAFIPASEVISHAIVSQQAEPIINKPHQLDIFEAVKPLKKVFTPAKNLLEAEKFVTDNSIAKNVDFVWIKDIDVANQINQTLFELQETYGVRELDSLGQNVKSRTAYMSANFQRLSINHTTFKNMNNISTTYDKYEAGYQDILDRNIFIVKRNIEAGRNPMQWRKKLKELEEQKKYARYTVHYGKESLTSDTLVHEFAHILHDQRTGGINGTKAINKKMQNPDGSLSDLAKELNRENYKNYVKARSNGDKYKISAYAASNEHEFFAETFTMYHRKDATLPSYLVEYFDRYLALTK
ncbi:zinc-dependent peptidase [Pedobacter cryoconitis]|uniref:Phage Mu protein F like protein n=1 Tax=Pedobacter cryoconitis TaxID=188932 RepID=A0A327S890_9SPHI|nr:zinc-dependent peptidase [Pedobacter cryoconitis]RAJ24988.1 phage Mu protein F like protein [Pedobacter cryoconitis]